MADGEEILKYMKGLIQAHVPSELPAIFGTTDQAEKLLGIMGEWKKAQEGIRGKVYDDVRDFFFGDPIANRILTGRDLNDWTPVGYVTHPAPLGIFSPLYPLPLLVQAIEGVFELDNPEPKPDKEAEKKFEDYLEGLQERAEKKYATKLGLGKSYLELKMLEKKLEEAYKRKKDEIESSNYVPDYVI